MYSSKEKKTQLNECKVLLPFADRELNTFSYAAKSDSELYDSRSVRATVPLVSSVSRYAAQLLQRRSSSGSLSSLAKHLFNGGGEGGSLYGILQGAHGILHTIPCMIQNE
jgi:hypothetical protein